MLLVVWQSLQPQEQNKFFLNIYFLLRSLQLFLLTNTYHLGELHHSLITHHTVYCTKSTIVTHSKLPTIVKKLLLYRITLIQLDCLHSARWVWCYKSHTGVNNIHTNIFITYYLGGCCDMIRNSSGMVIRKQAQICTY